MLSFAKDAPLLEPTFADPRGTTLMVGAFQPGAHTVTLGGGTPDASDAASEAQASSFAKLRLGGDKVRSLVNLSFTLDPKDPASGRFKISECK